jgi:hypothetical protein
LSCRNYHAAKLAGIETLKLDPSNDGLLQSLRRQLHKLRSQHAAKTCTTRLHRLLLPVAGLAKRVAGQ